MARIGAPASAAGRSASACSAGVTSGRDEHDVGTGVQQRRHPPRRHRPAADDEHPPAGEHEPQRIGVGGHFALTPAASKVATSCSTRAALATIGSASTAPVPSPRRRPRSTSGPSPRCASATEAPGSAER